jgi:site-specific DNA-methyltransferase (adenine-specific)
VANWNDRNRPVANYHPTVKPIKLMQYLCRLITPVWWTILDPYVWSWSTGIGAKLWWFDFIGIEREEEYVELARARIDARETE